MGGGRCIFRDCFVSFAHNPGMHFFRFPVNDAQRYAIWIKMAGAESILKLPKDQQRNKLICARHFRDDNFMNYKKDRIIRGKAIPTLMRISKTQAYDYEQLDAKGEPKLITLAPPDKPHLIPPPDFECPLGLSDGDGLSVSDRDAEEMLESLLEDDKPRTSKQSDRATENMSEYLPEVEKPSTSKKNSLKRSREPSETPKGVQKVKILNNFCVQTPAVAGYVSLNCTDLSENTSFVVEDGDSLEEGISNTNIELAEEKDVEQIETVLKAHFDGMVIKYYKKKLDQQRQKSDTTILELQKHNMRLEKDANQKDADLTAVIKQYNEAKAKCTELAAELQQLKQTQETQLSPKINEYQKKIKLLSEALTSLQTEYKDLQIEYTKLKAAQQQSNTVSTSSNITTNTPIVSGSAQSLTKAQLFNGIKKYLSATMIALLRMQMFGSTEREWKPDERQASVDVLGLGERVYRYFTDEWRFYLPSLSVARVWANEALMNADNDEDL